MNNPIKTLTRREWCLWIGSLGMIMPMPVWPTITWLKNLSKENCNEVEIQKPGRKHVVGLLWLYTPYNSHATENN